MVELTSDGKSVQEIRYSKPGRYPKSRLFGYLLWWGWVRSPGETHRSGTSPGAESIFRVPALVSTFWVPAVVGIGSITGRNPSIRHKSGR